MRDFLRPGVIEIDFRNVRTLALLLLALVVAVPAAATTFILMDERDLVARSVATALGTVSRVEISGSDTDGIRTNVFLQIDEVISGEIDEPEIVLQEPGGRLGNRTERVFGAAPYAVGEEVLVFVEQAADGTFRTAGMAMGKYRIEVDGRGRSLAVRDADHNVTVLDPTARSASSLVREERPLAELIASIRDASASGRHSPRRARRSRRQRPKASQTRPAQPAFTFLGTPSRWFEPDNGLPVFLLLDPTGDSGIGPDDSRTALLDALAAWSHRPLSSLVLSDGGPIEPAPFAGCPDANRIVFNDPFDELTDPTECRGILAVGGFCNSDEMRVVSNVSFRRIVNGKVTFNNGWAGCPEWSECGLAEVATHEIGHTIGLGHTTDKDATMHETAHFDGRCADLRPDDLAGLRFAYPEVRTPTRTKTPTPSSPTATATRTSFPSRTPTMTRTASPTRTSTRTSRPTQTRTPTRTSTPTRTMTPAPTPTPGGWPPSGTWLDRLLQALR